MVQLYDDDKSLIDVLSHFVSDALLTGRTSVVFVTASHKEQLEKRLSACGVDTTQAASEGRYITRNAADVLSDLMKNGSVDEAIFHGMVDGILAQARASTAGRAPRIAVFGELVGLLWAGGKSDEVIRLEQFWNDLAAKHPISLLCAYPLHSFTNDKEAIKFLKMCDEHTGVFPAESYADAHGEQQRLRSVAELQHKTQMLEREVASRHGEEQFRLFVDAVQDYAIFMLDVQGNVATWNRGAKRIKQYEAAEIIGKHFSCFYPEEDLLLGKPQWELLIAEKEGRFEDEGWRVRRDGTRFWANVIITAVRDRSGKLIGFGKVTRDITERMEAQSALQKEVVQRREAEQQLQRSEKSLRRLSLHLLRTQDEERRHIARELHDSVGQLLAALGINMAKAESEAYKLSPEAAALVHDNAAMVSAISSEIRTISHLLHPPLLDVAGLRSALRWYVDGFSHRSNIETVLEIPEGLERLPEDAEIAIFRVIQECLTNVHRHSGSACCAVKLIQERDQLKVEVSDAGCGIPQDRLSDIASSGGVGFRGMRERLENLAGTLEISSSEKGTTVTAVVPIRRDCVSPADVA